MKKTLSTYEINIILKGFKINANCVNAFSHRHFAFYDLELHPGCRIRKLELFSREIGLALKSKTNPIITTLPEKGLVRLSITTSDADLLYFDDLYDASEAPSGILPFLLGENDNGNKLWTDIAMNPHMLVAGGTGSGKSTFLHVLIANTLKRNDTWLYLIDPKSGVEFGKYEDYSNGFVAKDYTSTIYILEQLIHEMNNRYVKLNRYGYQSIEQNTSIFPKCLTIIDEAADLMMFDSSRDNPRKGCFEKYLVTLAQKSRAVGMYFVLATQRPSVDVITGLIKSNFTARVACKVSSMTDSKVVLDQSGAESLLGRGDAIINNYANNYSRFQVAYTNPSLILGA